MATFVNEDDIKPAIKPDPESDDSSDEKEIPEVEDELEVDLSVFGGAVGLADVTLVVEGRPIPVVKAVLSLASPVFRIIFQSNFKEKNQVEIRLYGKKFDSFVTFLRCIYPDVEEEVTGLTRIPGEYPIARLVDHKPNTFAPKPGIRRGSVEELSAVTTAPIGQLDNLSCFF
ncbi:BTB and MATH domain-containing protein 36-like isoform X2 [Mya arenaria]|uniref:BTB and MATH domain-containing protein 36-like isoform X2 n=1 Tax=Mya arenaria TaxID=6604 RepID=UPI0022E5A996|nr:BTB and MATH domain-containing protein 36-like isoform X2 [Mya arenaria]